METPNTHPLDKMSSQLMSEKIERNLHRMQYQELSLADRRKLEQDTNDMLFILSERDWYPEEMEGVA